MCGCPRSRKRERVPAVRGPAAMDTLFGMPPGANPPPPAGGDAANPLARTIEVIVAAYRRHDDIARLLRELEDAARDASPDAIAIAAEPFRDIPEVIGPLYERIVDRRPDDARALVVLASAYWMSGRGPELVGELASRAIAADPGHRGGWHLWALVESDPRKRVDRWGQVATRFPADELARANLADNAASLAGAEEDPEALALAIRTYESLLLTATHPEQRSALEQAIRTLRSWRL